MFPYNEAGKGRRGTNFLNMHVAVTNDEQVDRVERDASKQQPPFNSTHLAPGTRRARRARDVAQFLRALAQMKPENSNDTTVGFEGTVSLQWCDGRRA